MQPTADISNRKLAGVAPPAWRPYRGVSVLYDPPGCAALSGVERLEALSRRAPAHDGLYRRLRELADEIEAESRAEGVPLCLLPRLTYHVTLCDVVNQGTQAHVAPDQRPEIAATLSALPDSLLWPGTLMRLLADPEIYWAVWRQPASYRVAALEMRGHALVAALEPADAESAAATAAHDAARRALLERLTARLSVPAPAWHPHLTLGYVANDEHAAHARAHLVPRWQAAARQRTEGRSVTLRSAAVYGFTDMVSFWRRAR